MYNTMNGVNVAEKLGLGPEVRELKFGSSFTSGGRGQQQGSFHSVRYDFKPASVDTSKMATLDVGPNGQVTISMPNVDGNGTTVFKGARKPYAKECVLIIDQDTGEVVLEKLTHNIQVKRTREEGGSKKSSGGLSMPSAPPPQPESKKTQPPPPASFKQDPKVVSRVERDEPKKAIPPKSLPQIQHQTSSSKRSPMPPYHQQRQSPNNGPSPGHVTSPPLSFSPAGSSSQEPARPVKQQPPPAPFSLTNFDDLLTMTTPVNPPPQPPTSLKPNHPEKLPLKESSSPSASLSKPINAGSSGSFKNPPASALSESSSGEDSSSSSSSDEEDDDSSDMEEVPDITPIPAIPIPVAENSRSPALGNDNSRGRPQHVAPSMPTNLLCEDLQLSESGSDSE